LVEGRSSVLESMIQSPAVPAEGFPATLTSVSTTFPPLGLVDSITDDGGGSRFSPQRALLVGSSETLHGYWILPKVNLLTQN
ncbi:MAG: hypothetical protein O7A06_11210, partial [Acidobacteria bacterium]|nr:hypothetical protein [Acidobacteriota bacterium]